MAWKYDEETKTIKVNRGDKLPLTLSLPIDEENNYTFKVGDKVTFGVYEKKGYSKNAMLLKEIIVEEERKFVDISLTGEETRIGELIDKPVEYVYEIQLNDDETVIGQDDDGDKIFELWAEGSNIK